MSVSEPCPPSEQLQRLAADELPAGEAAALVAHLDWCSPCQRRLEALVSSTTLVNAVGPAHQSEAPLQDILRQLKTDTEPVAASRQRPTDWVRSFLGPPAVA